MHKISLWLCFFPFDPGEIKHSARSEMITYHNGGVQILCKCPEDVRQFRLQLLKGTQVFCNLTKAKGSGNTPSTENLKSCQLSNDSVSFFLSDLDSSHASYYICNLSIFDPPPFQEIVTREYLHVYGKTLFSSSECKCTYALWQLFSLTKTNKYLSCWNSFRCNWWLSLMMKICEGWLINNNN